MIYINNDIFSLYYTKYYYYVYNMLHLKIYSIEDAEDLTQEIFITLFNNFNKITDVKKWLHAAVNYASQNFYRDNKYSLKSEQITEDNFSTEMPFLLDEMLLHEAFKKANCDDVDMKVLQLVGMHKAKHTTIAHLLGMSRRQVAYRYKQLKVKLLLEFKTMGISCLNDLVG